MVTKHSSVSEGDLERLFQITRTYQRLLKEKCVTKEKLSWGDIRLFSAQLQLAHAHYLLDHIIIDLMFTQCPGALSEALKNLESVQEILIRCRVCSRREIVCYKEGT